MTFADVSGVSKNIAQACPQTRRCTNVSLVLVEKDGDMRARSVAINVAHIIAITSYNVPIAINLDRLGVSINE